MCNPGAVPIAPCLAPLAGAVCFACACTLAGSCELSARCTPMPLDPRRRAAPPASVVLAAGQTLTVTGSLTLTGTTVVDVTLVAGALPALTVDGTAALDGTLKLSLSPGVPLDGTYVPVMVAGNVTGSFAAVVVVQPSGDSQCTQIGATAVELPSAFGVLLSTPGASCGGLSTAAIAGSAVGGVVLLTVLIVVLSLVGRARGWPCVHRLFRQRRRPAARRDWAVDATL